MVNAARLIKDFVRSAKRDDDIAGAFLFGSRAEGSHSRQSDVDICIFMRKSFRGSMTKKRLMYTQEGLDVRIFQQLPLYIKIRVLKQGKTLFVSDNDSVYDSATDAIKDFEYFRPRYELIIGGIVDG